MSDASMLRRVSLLARDKLVQPWGQWLHTGFAIWAGWVVVVSSLLSLACMHGVTVRQQAQDRAWAQAQAQSQSVVLTLQARTQHIDDILRHTQDSFKRYGLGWAAKDTLNNAKNAAADLPYGAIHIVNAAGESLMALPRPDVHADFATMAQAARSRSDDAPMTVAVTYAQGHCFARVLALRYADGSYAGAVVGILAPQWLHNTLTQLAPPTGTRMVVKHADAVVASNTTGMDEALEDDPTWGPGLRRLAIPSLDAQLDVHLKREALNPDMTLGLEYLVTAVLLAIGFMTAAALALTRAVAQRMDSERQAEEAHRSALLTSRFLANVSHGLRTPMTGVLGAVDLLMATQPSPAQKNFLEWIQRSGHHLMGVLNDVLDMSRIDAFAVSINPQPTAVLTVLEDILHMAQPQAQRQGLVLYAHLELPEALRIDVDAFRLTQIVTNLLGNAIQFTPQGHVLVQACCKRVMAQEVLEISVTDTGIGMNAEQVRQLFQHLDQDEATASRRVGGSGLGWMIAKELAQRMGGTIDVQSALGQGSCFTLTLPVTNAQWPQDSRTLDMTQAPVLISVSDELLRQSIQTHLNHLGVYWQNCEQAHWRDLHSELVIFDKTSREQFCALFRCHSTCIELHTALDKTDSSLSQPGPERPGRLTVLTEPVRRHEVAHVVSNLLPLRQWQKIDPSTPKIDIDESALLQLQGMKVLVAEDNTVTQKILQAFLTSVGCDAVFVMDGRAAVQAVAVRTFELVLMDCYMPELDGYTATQQIRAMEAALPDQPRTPIVALTAATTEADVKRCFEVGMDEVCSKPISRQRLIAKLLQWRNAHMARGLIEVS